MENNRAINDSERDALAAIDGVQMLAQVETWAAINSGSRHLEGLAAMRDVLAGAFACLGVVHVVLPADASQMLADGQVVPLAHGDNLHLSVRPDAPVRALLTGHYDTVFGVDHPFQACRWREKGVLNGPGVADMKGGIAIILAALQALETSPFAGQIGYEVVLNADEEVASPGSAPLLAACAQRVHCGLTFEPALPDGAFAAARPGSGNFSIHVQGRAVHAGREPEKGRNAVVAAADLAVRLAALVAPDLKVNVARIEGGGANNVVPDSAVVRVNMRPDSKAVQARAEADLARLIAAVSGDHEVRIDQLGGFARPPKPFDGQQRRLFELVRAAGADLGQSMSWRDVGGVCDGNNLAATGLAVIDTMGARGGSIHSEDEFLIVESLVERAHLAALVLMRIAARGFPRAI